MNASILAADDIHTTAALPENKQIWPLPKLDIPDLITVKADQRGQA